MRQPHRLFAAGVVLLLAGIGLLAPEIALAGGTHGGRAIGTQGLLTDFYRYQATRILFYISVLVAGAGYVAARLRPPGEPAEGASLNLLELSLLGTLSRWRGFPLLFQLPAVLVFATVVFLGFTDTQDGTQNLATLLVWVIWWPGLVILTLLSGRTWCLACPLAAAGDWVQRLIGLGRRFPRRFRNLWLQILVFTVLTWAFTYWNVVSSPLATAVLLLGLLAVAVVVSAVFERRSFCRYVCPIGGLLGVYSLMAPLELRVENPATCREHARKECYTGTLRGAGCPMLEYPPAMDRNANCNLCLECVRTCSPANIALRFRPLGRDLWSSLRRRRDEATLAAALFGVTLGQAAVMTSTWQEWQGRLAAGLAAWAPVLAAADRGEIIPFSLTYLAVTVAFPLGLLFLAGTWAARRYRGTGKKETAIRRPSFYVLFGYFFIPAGLMLHLSHNLEHLLGEGRLLVPAVRRLWGLVNQAAATPFLNWDVAPLAQPLLTFWLQMGTVFAGVLLSFSLVRRLAAAGLRDGNGSGPRLPRPAVPPAALLPLVLMLVVVVGSMFSALGQPMAQRSRIPALARAFAGGLAPEVYLDLYRIAFVSHRTGNGEVYVMRGDGTDLQRLTWTDGNILEASWSPDGTRLVLISDETGSNELWVMDADGGGKRRLTHVGRDNWAPMWSPDGRRIAFVSGVGAEADIYVVNADGSALKQLTGGTGWDYVRSWSPDGTRLLLETNRDGNMEVYVMNADGTNQVNLTRHPAEDGDPSWSPDGRHIAFSSDRAGNREIYVMNADGTGVRRLTRNGFWDGHPYWSPDGTRLLFESNRGPGGTFEIVTMYRNGAGERMLTSNGFTDRHPSWSPDGRQIVFESLRDGNMEIYVMDADGGNERNITRHPADDMHPSW